MAEEKAKSTPAKKTFDSKVNAYGFLRIGKNLAKALGWPYKTEIPLVITAEGGVLKARRK